MTAEAPLLASWEITQWDDCQHGPVSAFNYSRVFVGAVPVYSVTKLEPVRAEDTTAGPRLRGLLSRSRGKRQRRASLTSDMQSMSTSPSTGSFRAASMNPSAVSSTIQSASTLVGSPEHVGSLLQAADR